MWQVPGMRLTKIAAVFLCLPCAVMAQALQSQPATTRLQDAVVVAKGSTISITRLPIHTANGTIFRDVTIQLQVDSQGHVTLATDAAGRAVAAGMPPAPVPLPSVPSGGPSSQPIELAQRPSPPIVMQIFRAGTYATPDGGLVRVEDRGNDLINHVPMWTLSSDGASGLGSATWYSGPPQMNPRYRRLRTAGITDTSYAYGTSDSGTAELFASGALIGVQQVGPSALRIVSFKRGCCTDMDTPTASLTLTYQGR